MIERTDVQGTGPVATTLAAAMRARHWRMQGEFGKCEVTLGGQRINASEIFEPHDGIHYLLPEFLPAPSVLAVGFSRNQILLETPGHNPWGIRRAFVTSGWLLQDLRYLKAGFTGHVTIEPNTDRSLTEKIKSVFPRCLWNFSVAGCDLSALMRELPLLIERLFMYGAFRPSEDTVLGDFLADEYETVSHLIRIVSRHLRWEQQPLLMTQGAMHPHLTEEQAPEISIDIRATIAQLEALARNHRTTFLRALGFLTSDQIRSSRLTVAELLLRAEVETQIDGERSYLDALNTVDRIEEQLTETPPERSVALA